MRFSILWSVSPGPFFIYLLYLFIYLYYNYFHPKTTISNKNNKKFYFFLLIEIFLNKLKQLSKMLLGSFSEKKMHCFEGKEVILVFHRVIEQVQISFYPCFLGKYIQNFMWYCHDLQKCKNEKKTS